MGAGYRYNVTGAGHGCNVTGAGYRCNLTGAGYVWVQLNGCRLCMGAT